MSPPPNAQTEMRRWVQEPLYWAKKVSGEGFDPWSGQVQLWEAYGQVLNAKLKRYQGATLTEAEQVLAGKMGISVMAGQGLGKERTLALMLLHYLFVLSVYQVKGVVTAPAGPTLFSTLWPEFEKVIRSSPVLAASFEKNAKRIYLTEDGAKGNFCRIEPRTIQANSSSDDQAVTLAGIHALGVFYGVTEASGVPEAVFKPLQGGLTDPLSLIVLIFNPTRRTGFAADSQAAHRRDWVCLQWSGRTLKAEKQAEPGRFGWFNAEAQDILIRKFGTDSDFVRVRVDGLPPRQASDTLIGYEDVLAATERVVETHDGDPVEIAVDVAGADGGDQSIVLTLRGPRLVSLVSWQNKKTYELAELVASQVKTEVMNLPAGTQVVVGVDSIGMGRGVFENLADVQRVPSVSGVDVSEQALDPTRFHRLRDQLYWELREAFVETRTISLRLVDPRDPDRIVLDDELIGQLTSIKWAEVGGKIKIQGKGSSSGIPNCPPLATSPDKMDALAIAWFLYRHRCSRMPASQRRLRSHRARPVSWRAL